MLTLTSHDELKGSKAAFENLLPYLFEKLLDVVNLT
jgi:hypothetical protein